MEVAASTLRQHLASVPGARVFVGMQREDELDAFLPESEPVCKDADLIEPGPFVAKPIPASAESGFSHFLDGAEKRRLAGYVGMLPIYLAHTSAALVERRDQQMLVLDDMCYTSAFDFIVPDGSNIGAFPNVGHCPVSVPAENTDISYRQRVRREISIKRELHEIDVATKYSGRCLLIDGGIGNILDRLPQGVDVVGVVKSHQHRYFASPERVQTILGLKCGERTSVFRRDRDSLQGREAYSFYMRLFESATEGPLFGLIRVEIPASEEKLARVDEFAGWLMVEKAPLSLPDSRYDKMIYPIRVVEQHLKARQPSEAAIRGLIG